MNKNLKLINEIIKASVIHGGDAGGPYYCDEEGVTNAMKDYMKTLVVDKNVYIKTIDDIPQFCQDNILYNDVDGRDGTEVYIGGGYLTIDVSLQNGNDGVHVDIPLEDVIKAIEEEKQ